MNRYNDVFHEEIVVRKNKSLSNLLYAVFTVFMYIAFIGALLGLQRLVQSIGDISLLLRAAINFVLFGGTAAGIYFFKDSLRTEYEYSYTNGIMDVASVKNNKKRNELLSFSTKDELELMAPIMTNEFNKYLGMKNIKKLNAWLNRDMKKYFALVRKDNQRILLVFEPREEFIAVIRKYNPQKVKLN